MNGSLLARAAAVAGLLISGLVAPALGGEPPSSSQGFGVRGAGRSITHTIGARSFIAYIPSGHSQARPAPLLIVLHGGLGNAAQIQSYIGLEPYADRYGFLIAYADGTKAARLLRNVRKAWNAGECCGLPGEKNVDDVGFVAQVVHEMTARYGADPRFVYGTGHSNGAMMTLRILCESDLYRAAVPFSGTLTLSAERCPKAKGKRILAIHGAEDYNVPVAGGYTEVGVNRTTSYRSQTATKEIFARSGADYRLLILPDAAHKPETLNAALLQTEGVTLPQKIVSFLGLEER